jgi:peptide deformylase
MAVLPIYLYNAKVLRDKTKPVKELDEQTKQLISDMFETMEVAHGCGLAANQVGSTASIVVIDVSELEEYKDVPKFVMINPVIEEEWGEFVTYDEGCLSLPQLRVEVDRPEAVQVKFMDGNFEEKVVEADGFLARVIQHEVDHLNGLFMTDHLNGLRKRLTLPSLKKIMAGEMEADYPIAPLDQQHILTARKRAF